MLLFAFFIVHNITNAQAYKKYLKKVEVSPRKFLLNVPVERPSGYYILKAKINSQGEVKTFLLDSGSPYSFISPEVAKEAGVNAFLTDSLSDGFTKTASNMGYASIIIGSVTFDKVLVAIDSSVYYFPVEKIDGIIGANLMRKCVWAFRDSSIAISNNSHFINTNEYEKEKLSLVYAPKVKVGVYRNYEGWALFDLGYNGFYTFNKKDFFYTGLRKKKVLRAAGVNYATLFTSSPQLDSMEMSKPSSDFIFGNKRFKNIIIETHDDDITSDILGLEILNYYDIVLDMPKKKIYTKQLKDEYEFGDYFSFGFGYKIEGNEIIVKYVWDDSPAYAANIKPGMHITKINDLNLIEMNNQAIEQHLEAINSFVYHSDSISLKIKELPSEVTLKVVPLMK